MGPLKLPRYGCAASKLSGIPVDLMGIHRNSSQCPGRCAKPNVWGELSLKLKSESVEAAQVKGAQPLSYQVFLQLARYFYGSGSHPQSHIIFVWVDTGKIDMY